MKYVVYLKMKRAKMNEKTVKEYNARGKRIYKNAINRENTKKQKKQTKTR